jgi:hypothetical protein
MPAKATLPALAESAITTLFENAINGTRIFWSQRGDASLVCVQWSWCCPEIPAVLSGMDAVVFITSGPSSVIKAHSDALVVCLDARRVWGKWTPVREPPHGVTAGTWDDLREVVI